MCLLLIKLLWVSLFRKGNTYTGDGDLLAKLLSRHSASQAQRRPAQVRVRGPSQPSVLAGCNDEYISAYAFTAQVSYITSSDLSDLMVIG